MLYLVNNDLHNDTFMINRSYLVNNVLFMTNERVVSRK